jgi:hypothetical protein
MDMNSQAQAVASSPPPSAQPQVFKHDHVLRDENRIPLGRVVLVNDKAYEPGKPIQVALMTVPVSKMKSVLGWVFYVDGRPYRVQSDIHPIRVREAGGKHMVNNFTLVPVS